MEMDTKLAIFAIAAVVSILLSLLAVRLIAYTEGYNDGVNQTVFTVNQALQKLNDTVQFMMDVVEHHTDERVAL
jgi:cell shape-determining protein MreC